MSTVSSANRDLDVWEFVACARCFLLFSPDPSTPPPVPFWLTECGHVICNNHLNSDQSCMQCGAQKVQIIPLSRKMELPMANWFSSMPSALESAAHSTRFQLEMIASSARFYRKKYLHQRGLFERLKSEVAETMSLRKINDELRSENEQLRQYAGISGQGSATASSENGKRRRTDAYRNGTGARDFSSPHSVSNLLGPNRLTLPANHQEPKFTQQMSNSDVNSHSNRGTAQDQQRDRPGSSRFVQQYAYVPPQTPQQQNASSMLQSTPAHQTHPRNNSLMPPPPTPVIRNAQNRTLRPDSLSIANISRSSVQMPTNALESAQPPPSRFGFPPGSKSSGAHLTSSANSNRFIPSMSSGVPSQQAGFIPQTPSGGSRRFLPPTSESRAPSRAAGTPSRSNQGPRLPFVPQYG